MEPGPANQSSESNIFSLISSNFRNDVIKGTLKLKYSDSKTKITEEAVEMVKEVTKAIIVEAAIRATKQASFENKTTVNISHVETILPQLMLDFP